MSTEVCFLLVTGTIWGYILTYGDRENAEWYDWLTPVVWWAAVWWFIGSTIYTAVRKPKR